MYSVDDLISHLSEKHGISVDQNQIVDLRNIGYYHDYKGYRFIRSPYHRIKFTDLRQVTALNRFDIDLKSLVYPKIMFIENALKSYFLESLLSDSQAHDIPSIFKKSLTNYKAYKSGSREYKKEYAKLMNLQVRINTALIRDYNQGKEIENHFFNSDKPIPVWAVFESLTLGEFGIFFSCTNMAIKKSVSEQLGLRKSLNADGGLLTDIIFCLKNLRNAIAHNGVIFDTRFATQKVESRVKKLLETEMEIENIDFSFIVSYVALIVYLLKALKETKDCVSFINEYEKTIEMLSANFPQEVYFKIVGTQEKSVLEKMRAFVKRTS